MSTHQEQGRGLWEWRLVVVVVGLSVLYLGQLFLFNEFNETTNRQAIAVTARIAVVLFCGAFGAAALHHFMRQSFSWWLRMNRRYLGIAFAILHLTHLAFLVLLQYCFHPVFEMADISSLTGGGIAYLFVVLMLLTSFPATARFLSKRQWSWLHTIGGYWIWFIFFNSYWGKALEENEYFSVVFLLALVVLLRIVKFFKK